MAAGKRGRDGATPLPDLRGVIWPPSVLPMQNTLPHSVAVLPSGGVWRPHPGQAGYSEAVRRRASPASGVSRVGFRQRPLRRVWGRGRSILKIGSRAFGLDGEPFAEHAAR